MHYYNEHNAYRAAVLRERISEGLLPQGVVDERDIQTVPDEDFLGYEQVHLFAGIGGFPLGLRLAGFPEHVRIVDGGFPCQDISNAGKRAGITGSRSRLWREMVRCIRVVRPQLVFVENVAALLCRGMGEVLGDLAAIGYDAEGDCVSAADVGAPHLRRRIWIVAHSHESGPSPEWNGGPAWSDGATSASGDVSHAGSEQHEGSGVADEWPRAEEFSFSVATERRFAVRGESSGQNRFVVRNGEVVAYADGGRSNSGSVSDTPETRLERPDFGEVGDAREWRHPIIGRSGRWPVEPNVGRVAHGVPKRVDRLAALGDAIVPQCAAEAVRRFLKNKI